MRKLLAVPMLLLLLAAGCGSDGPTEAPPPPPPPTPTTAGTWTGTLQSVFQLRMTLVENGGSIGGSGTFTVPGEQVAISVGGTHVFPNVSMTIQPSGFQAMNFQGTITQDGRTLTGAVSGSGFNNQSIVLTKQ